MKKLALLFFLFFSSYTFSQIEEQPVHYKLYPTDNIYNFLKLDTSTGFIWVVQWSLESESRFSSVLNPNVLVDRDEFKNYDELPAGRFELYPTQNTYTFLLQDVRDGRNWQVQWSLDPDEWFIIEIE